MAFSFEHSRQAINFNLRQPSDLKNRESTDKNKNEVFGPSAENSKNVSIDDNDTNG